MLIQVSPVLIAVLATVFLGERFTVWLGLGLLLAFVGIVLIAVSQPGGHNDLLGVALCLLAALVYSISLVVQKPLVSRLSALHVTWFACTIGALVCLPFAGQLVDDTAHASASDVWWVIYLGLFPTAIAFTTYAFALRHMTASSLGITTYLVPPLTIVMGWLFLGEVPPDDGVRRRGARPGRGRGRAAQAACPRGGATTGVVLSCCGREHRRRRADRPGRRAAPLLPGARDVPLDHAHRTSGLRARAEGFAEESQGAGRQPGALQRFPGRGPRLGAGLGPDRRPGVLPGCASSWPVSTAPPPSTSGSWSSRRCPPCWRWRRSRSAEPGPNHGRHGLDPDDLHRGACAARQVSASSRTCWSSNDPVGELVRLTPLST